MAGNASRASPSSIALRRLKANERQHARLQGLELRACAPRPRRFLPGLYQPNLLPALPQDGRGAGDADRRGVDAAEGSRWDDIKDLSGEALGTAYARLLETLSRQPGIIGAIFLKAQNEIQDPAKLKRLVGLIDGETWLALPVDVKGSIYEGLLARNAEDVKSGAGQYFTPRPVIEAMVQVVDPKPHQTVHDPACGTAGFLLAAWEHMKQNPKARDKAVYSALKNKFSGIDIVPEVVRLAAMNLYLHGITGVESIVEAKDALMGAGGKSYDIILTNPPFGKKQSYRIVRDDGEIDSEREDYDRQDFFVTTSNKQLNFLQHIMTVLAPNGKLPWCCPTTCCSKAAPERRSAAGC